MQYEKMSWTKIPRLLTFDIELLSYVIDRIGTTDFDIALLHFVNQVSPIPIMEICGYVYAVNATPKIAGWCGTRGDTPDRIEKYTSYYYLKDATLDKLPSINSSHANFVQALSKQKIQDEDYCKHFFETPNFKTEVTMVHREKGGWNIAKFFLEENSLSGETISQIGKLAALIYPLGKKHALSPDNKVSDQSRPKVQDRLILLLENRFPQLTQRERQVCAYTILGNSAKKIGELLNVSPNTVITYRQRAYDRLCISNANTLIRELI